MPFTAAIGILTAWLSNRQSFPGQRAFEFLAMVYIVGRADVGEYGVAIVYAAMLIVFMLVVLLAIQLAVGLRRPGVRAAARDEPAEVMAVVQT